MTYFAVIRILTKKEEEWEDGKIPGKLYISPSMKTREEVEDWLKLELKRYEGRKVKISKAIFPAKDDRESLKNYKFMLEIVLS